MPINPISNLMIKAITGSRLLRSIVTFQVERRLYKNIVEGDSSLPENARIEKFHGIKAIYMSALKNLNRGLVSKKAAQKIVEILVDFAMLGGGDGQIAIKNFKEKYKTSPPSFVTIAPTKNCNLNCVGCYASSAKAKNESLEWDLLDKTIQEMHDEMGMRFFVITGGEPFLYKSNGKTIIDLVKKWSDSYFLSYTNGTLITEKVAKELAEAGNFTPSISVEGFEKETDCRRGKGTYEKVLKAIANLKKEGVPFGVSVTATKDNIDTLLQDKFYDFSFEELGASYMWIFQYMPIGMKFTTELMISPKQRLELFKQWRKIIREKQWFVADFWNSAILTSGCISCAKEGGYFYIDWNGNIMPCVFIPYYKDNVKDLFADGKKISDALFSDLFVKGREWQEKYLNKDDKLGNLLTPCFTRDNHKAFLDIVRETGAKPEDEAAKQALEDDEYHKRMMKFDDDLKEIMDPVWEQDYANEMKLSVRSLFRKKKK